MLTHTNLDEITEVFTTGEYSQEVQMAKEQFYEWAGSFDIDKHDFEMKMALFFDWYLFEREHSSYGKPPIQFFKPQTSFGKTALTELIASRWSLFQFLKLKGKNVYIRDLVADETLILVDSEITEGFSKGQVFSARLFHTEGSIKFSNVFCLHQIEARKYILKQITVVKKMQKKQPENFLKAKKTLIMDLIKKHYIYDRYRHLSVLDIYTENSKVKL